MKTILFLCTGNYYRSRFAEELFNHRADAEGLAWVALSRALAIERGVNNVGAISPLALAGLRERGVVPRGHERPPAACLPSDLAGADLVVALSETEHRILMQERFVTFEGRTVFWQIEDIGFVPADIALALIEWRVEELLATIKGGGAA